MKISIQLPHGKIDIEREPMDNYKFYTMWACVTICIVAVAFFWIFK